MPFAYDPNFPPLNAELTSPAFRNQFQGLPMGPQGPAGANGNDGAPGAQGPQGAPGEVTNAQLSSAVSGTGNNSNAIATLDTPFADPDAESMRQRFNELVLALRR